MFNNVIYFIIVILIFSIYPPSSPRGPLSTSLSMMFFTWLVFAGYCRWAFARLLRRFYEEREGESTHAGIYQGLVLRLTVLAIGLFALDVYLFHLKHWLQEIPGLEQLTVGQGVIAISLFIFYQSTIWHYAHPAYEKAFMTGVDRRSFIRSNVRLNVPVVFPWFLISLVFDLLAISPWSGRDHFFNTPAGQIFIFVLFFVVLLLFMPPFMQYWWGCRPLPPSDKAEALRDFLRKRGFRHGGLLNWPIFEGRMLTAGIIGILPRFRYILVTDALMGVLDVEELKAVTAHEMGHARYRHLLLYGLLFLVYMILFFGLSQKYALWLDSLPFFIRGFVHSDSLTLSLYYIILSVPILLSLILYLRYVMGFFMRHFERQADLYSAEVMGSPVETIRSLEKIALLSGKIRELPSWHHFSIRQRVECLWRTLRDPELSRRQNRFVALCLGIYLVAVIGIGLGMDFGGAQETMSVQVAARVLEQMIQKEPENVDLYVNLAMIYHEMERQADARNMYEKAMTLDPERPVVLNNLAWILVTASDWSLRDYQRGLALAERAVELERTSTFLDTLAEAYYVNGRIEEAVLVGKEALSLATDKKDYYRHQLEKFEGETGTGHP